MWRGWVGRACWVVNRFSGLCRVPFTQNKNVLVTYLRYILFSTDIRLDWETYRHVPQDSQLLDLLVFIGEPLPQFKDGQEVVPTVGDHEIYQREDKPFIQVKLREHEGVCADRPFDVTPRQQVRIELTTLLSRVFISLQNIPLILRA